ncbi:MAG: hypothetical protein ACYDHF_06195 [Candidatus Cryosericum sp.]
MKTKNITVDGRIIWQLLTEIECEYGEKITDNAFSQLHGVDEQIGFIGSAQDTQPLGIRTPHHWFGVGRAYRFPPYRIYATIEDALQNRPHEGGCMPVYAVLHEFGGGFGLSIPAELRVGEPVAWSHDIRSGIHMSQCPNSGQK